MTFGGSAKADARLDGDWIVVEGAGNTLASMARDVADPKIFSYEEETGYAIAARSIRVAGQLAIGGAKTSGSLFRHVESLEFDVGQCGQARIALADEAARLTIENARVSTLHTDQGNDACNAEGNQIDVAAGALVMRASTITGNFVVRAGKGAVDLADAMITSTNHSGMQLGAGPARLAGLRLLDHQLYGMEVGPLEGPLLLEGCTVRGGGADLHVRGPGEVVARDCDFDSIRFAGAGASVRRQWTVRVRTNAPGARVTAASERGVGLPERVEATAGADGVAHLVLTEYVARPGEDYLRPGRNDATPHRLTIEAPDGRTIGSVANYRVLARGQEVRVP